MARGQYELPPGRPKPAFGPSRPPVYTTKTPSNSPPASVSSSPTTLPSPTVTQVSRLDGCDPSATKSEGCECGSINDKTNPVSRDTVEIAKVNEAIDTLARGRFDLVESEDAFQATPLQTKAGHPIQSLRSAIADYASLSMIDRVNASSISIAGAWEDRNSQGMKGGHSSLDTFDESLLERPGNALY